LNKSSFLKRVSLAIRSFDLTKEAGIFGSKKTLPGHKVQQKNVKFLFYFIRFIPGLITIFTSNSLRKETISKTKKAVKKNKRRNKPRWKINV